MCKDLFLSVFLIAALALPAFAERPALPEGKLPLLDAEWSNDGDKFNFVVLGDKTSGGEGKWPIYDRAVDQINLLRPDFVVSVGDMIPGHMEERGAWDAEWAEYMEHARRFEVPVFFTVGNHDIANAQTHQFWTEDFGPTYYNFEYKGCHFLILNTEEERFDGRGPRWQAMMDFAKTALDRYRDARHTFVFFHKPMWDDPRFTRDWSELESMLGERPFTVVAGHTHYLATDRRDGNLYVIQNATGGGIRLSDVREFGNFHGFGFVTVDGDDVTYAIVDYDDGLFPVDVAPLSFRKAVGALVSMDAEPYTVENNGAIYLKTTATFRNALVEPAIVRLRIGPVSDDGWEPAGVSPPWTREGDELVAEVPVRPGEVVVHPLRFHIAAPRLPYPPSIAYEVDYKGASLEDEPDAMSQMAAVPLYPQSAWKDVPRWQVAAPFLLGPINSQDLGANANFYKTFGPEKGYQSGASFDGIAWKAVTPDGLGLINFNAVLGTTDLACGFAAVRVYSPEAQRVHAAVYADNYAQVYLNGTLIEEAQEFNPPGGWVYAPLDLNSGWNDVVGKLINNRADWFLRLRIADPKGNLRFED